LHTLALLCCLVPVQIKGHFAIRLGAFRAAVYQTEFSNPSNREGVSVVNFSVNVDGTVWRPYSCPNVGSLNCWIACKHGGSTARCENRRGHRKCGIWLREVCTKRMSFNKNVAPHCHIVGRGLPCVLNLNMSPSQVIKTSDNVYSAGNQNISPQLPLSRSGCQNEAGACRGRTSFSGIGRLGSVSQPLPNQYKLPDEKNALQSPNYDQTASKPGYRRPARRAPKGFGWLLAALYLCSFCGGGAIIWWCDGFDRPKSQS
jgi:hypothetical protein